jgi:hypothetical protein
MPNSFEIIVDSNCGYEALFRPVRCRSLGVLGDRDSVYPGLLRGGLAYTLVTGIALDHVLGDPGRGPSSKPGQRRNGLSPGRRGRSAVRFAAVVVLLASQISQARSIRILGYSLRYKL